MRLTLNTTILVNDNKPLRRTNAVNAVNNTEINNSVLLNSNPHVSFI